MRTLIQIVGFLVVSGMLLPSLATADQENGIDCTTGVVTGTVNEDITIDDNNCMIFEAEIFGNIIVSSGSSLDVIYSQIHGDLIISQDGNLQIYDDTKIYGNIFAYDDSLISIDSGFNEGGDIEINGNLFGHQVFGIEIFSTSGDSVRINGNVTIINIDSIYVQAVQYPSNIIFNENVIIHEAQRHVDFITESSGQIQVTEDLVIGNSDLMDMDINGIHVSRDLKIKNSIGNYINIANTQIGNNLVVRDIPEFLRLDSNGIQGLAMCINNSSLLGFGNNYTTNYGCPL